jgi:DNA-binding MarR family transcriptional regulator
MPETIVRHEGEHLYAKQPASDCGRALSDAILRLRRAEQLQESRDLQLSGLSALDLRALRYLAQASRDDRELSPKDLIQILGTSSANVTNVVERLVNKGYVERVSHPTDRRAHYLVPTEEAIQRVDSTYASHHAAIVAVIDELPEEEALAACRVIERLADALDRLAPA